MLCNRLRFTAFIIFIITVLLCPIGFLTGCGEGDGGLAKWGPIDTNTSQGFVDVRGKIEAPTGNEPLIPGRISGSVRKAFALPSVQGVQVFVESRPEICTSTDAEGYFYLKNVPAGAQRFIAYTTMAGFSYRQRSPLYQLKAIKGTEELPNPMVLRESVHNVMLNISDLETGNPLIAEGTIWGFKVNTVNGWMNLGPFPESFSGEEVTISALGYMPYRTVVRFTEKSLSEIYLKLTPLGSVTGNRAPTSAILCEERYVRAGEWVSLAASGLDPDGDSIKWSWRADRGTFSNEEGAGTVYTAPFASGTAIIELTAADSQGASSRSVLKLQIIPGSSKPVDPNNRAPLSPYSPVPEDRSMGQGGNITLRWDCSDPDGDKLKYDVYFSERENELALTRENLTEKSYNIGGLKPYTQYMWQIVAYDEGNQRTASPIWMFTTGDLNNNAPYVPSKPSPADGSGGWTETVTCTWVGGDPDDTDYVTYTVLYGEDHNNLRTYGSTTGTKLELTDLKPGKTYYWKVIASDNRGKSSESSVWHFKVRNPNNGAPYAPVAIMPEDGEQHVSQGTGLEWEASDPDGDPITFDVYFGTERNNLRQVAKGLKESYYTFPSQGRLAMNTVYYWRVIVKDSMGAVNDNSVIWSFKTGSGDNRKPNKPVALSPADGSTAAYRPVVAWSCTDPDGDPLTYTLYLGKEQNLNESHVVLKDKPDTTWTTITDLTVGAQYFWRVKAKDSQGAETTSDIFSFWVKSRGAVDNTPPSIIRISPANGETNADIDKNVTVVFSEPLEDERINDAFEFIPQKDGLWTFENASTVKFTPSENWYPGSYYKLVVKDNKIKDASGNIMNKGTTAAFTFDAAMPVPEGFRSTGLPVALSSGETAVTSLKLGQGKSLYALAVNGSSQGSVSVRASAKAMPKDFHNRLRDLEKEFAHRPIESAAEPSGSLRCAVRASERVGDTRNFKLLNDSSSVTHPGGTLTAECMAVTDNFLIFKDKTVRNLNSSFFAEMSDRCERVIYPKLVENFGVGCPAGPDGERRIVILLTDKITRGVLGFFYAADLFKRSFTDSSTKYSNECKIIYLRADIDNEITRYGTIAHETQHMINFYYKNRAGAYEEVWLNEALSKYAEEVTGFGIDNGDDNTVGLIRMSQQNFANLSLTEWERGTANSYGLSYLFARFLSCPGRYRTMSSDMTKALCQSGMGGIRNVENATGEPFHETLGRWGMALYINDYETNSPDAYGFYGLNLAGKYNGVSLKGFNYTLGELQPEVPLLPYGVAGFRKVAGSSGNVNMSINTSSPAYIYFYDERP